MAHVLIVDDDFGIAWALATLAERMGHDVDTASAAEEAFVIAESSPPDLLLLDIRLPRMDGLTAISRLRQLTRDAPIIVMSAFSDIATINSAIGRGATSFLRKPFSMDEVRSLILHTLADHPDLVEPNRGA